MTKDWRETVVLAMVALLPLHTVFLEAWISWKPYLVLLAIVAVADLVEAYRNRTWPYRRSVMIALAVFLLVAAIGFPESGLRERFLRLFLALCVGGGVMLVVDRYTRHRGMADRLFKVIFWTGAVMAISAVATSLLAVGFFGESAIATVNDLPGVFRLSKPAYLDTGFLALTNWHQDPGYGSAWAVLWTVLVLISSLRGSGSGVWWVDGAVMGGLTLWVVMAFSRTGWLALPIAIVLVAWALTRESVWWRESAKRAAVAVGTAAIALSFVWLADVPHVGGDLDLQFAFRFSQGWDLLADLTGLFDSSVAFADRFAISEERADVWPEYIEMFQSNPVLGVGLSVGWQTNSIGQEPHNLIIELLAEMGVVGLVAFVGLLGTVVWRGRGGVFLAVLAVTFLPSMTQTVLFEPTWWLAAGLYLAGNVDPT